MKQATGILLALSFVAFSGLAQAQQWSYADHRPIDSNCSDIRQENQIAGALIGGVAGGLLGNEAAARGVEEEGRVLGAIIGALAGSEIGKRQVDCNPVYIGPADNTYRTSYRDHDYRNAPRNKDWNSTRYYDPYENQNTGNPVDISLYGGHDDNYAGSTDVESQRRECETVRRITYLPDGRKVEEQALACRDMQYGPWSLE